MRYIFSFTKSDAERRTTEYLIYTLNARSMDRALNMYQVILYMAYFSHL